MNKPIVSMKGVSKRFGSVEALKEVSLDIYPGEIFAMLGPSGCGKSTLLRILSGFETPTTGELLLDGENLVPLKPNKRPINMVFQSYAVFPHMSVADNVAYGLKMERVAKSEINDRVNAALAQVHLSDYAARMPEQLSGGQRQRVALARVLVKEPRLLLLDEPLSALDAKLRDAMRLELVKLQQSVGITFVIVTHDQAEAMAIADRIAVLESGRIRQVASPAELYQNPVDAFVADFIGNIHAFDVQSIETHSDSVEITAERIGALSLSVPSVERPELVASNTVVAIRPEHIKLTMEQPGNAHVCIQGALGDIAFQGQHSIVELILDEQHSITAIVSSEQAKELGRASTKCDLWASWQCADMLLLPKDAQHV